MKHAIMAAGDIGTAPVFARANSAASGAPGTFAAPARALGLRVPPRSVRGALRAGMPTKTGALQRIVPTVRTEPGSDMTGANRTACDGVESV